MTPATSSSAPETDRFRATDFVGWSESSWDLRRGLEVCEIGAEAAGPAQRDEARSASRTATPRSITAIA